MVALKRDCQAVNPTHAVTEKAEGLDITAYAVFFSFIENIQQLISRKKGHRKWSRNSLLESLLDREQELPRPTCPLKRLLP